MIGAGYDDSPESRQALDAARALGEPYGARIRALWVIALPRVQEEAPSSVDWDETIESLEEEYSAQLGELAGIEGRVTYGGRREELTQFGKDLDLLIVGSRGYGPLARLVHGSVCRGTCSGTGRARSWSCTAADGTRAPRPA